MTAAKVYMGPLLGMVEPTLRALDTRCAEVADYIVSHADDDHPLFRMRKPVFTMFGGVPVYEALPGEFPPGVQMMGISWPGEGPPSVAVVRDVMPADHDPGDEDRTS